MSYYGCTLYEDGIWAKEKVTFLWFATGFCNGFLLGFTKGYARWLIQSTAALNSQCSRNASAEERLRRIIEDEATSLIESFVTSCIEGLYKSCMEKNINPVPEHILRSFVNGFAGGLDTILEDTENTPEMNLQRMLASRLSSIIQVMNANNTLQYALMTTFRRVSER